MEINPSNRTLQQMRENANWQKFLVLLMRKQGLKEVDITMEDIEAMIADGTPYLLVHGKQRSVTLKLFPDEKTALEYLAEQQPKG